MNKQTGKILKRAKITALDETSLTSPCCVVLSPYVSKIELEKLNPDLSNGWESPSYKLSLIWTIDWHYKNVKNSNI